MPFITGRSLQERIDDHGPLETKEVLRIAMQTAQGLAAAHVQGLVHRDIKPANILLENGVERVRITDFGLARAVDDASQTQSGFIAGTPQYMAPEQARGESIDARADLFSLGSVMYAMCTGRPPFRAETTLAVLRRICDDEPRPLREINPEVPVWLAQIVEKLLAKTVAERFQSAEEVAELLGKWLAHVQQPLQIPPPAVVVAKANRRRRVLPLRFVAGAAAALTAGMLLAAGAIWLPGLLFEAPADPVANAAAGRIEQSSGSREPTVEVAAAAVQRDLADAAAIDSDLVRMRQQLEILESTPTSKTGFSATTEVEINAAIERLESELATPPLPVPSPMSKVRASRTN
jgi:serine/threonine-protein kinase